MKKFFSAIGGFFGMLCRLVSSLFVSKTAKRLKIKNDFLLLKQPPKEVTVDLLTAVTFYLAGDRKVTYGIGPLKDCVLTFGYDALVYEALENGKPVQVCVDINALRSCVRHGSVLIKSFVVYFA